MRSFLLLATLTALLPSCNKENVVPSSQPQYVTTPVPSVTTPVAPVVAYPTTAQLTYINQIKAQLPCPGRLPDMQFFQSGPGTSASKTTLVGPIQQGVAPGNPVAAYAGYSQGGHFVTIVKKELNNVVTGYDFIVSLCQIPGVILSPASIQQFGIDSSKGVVLDDDVNCVVNNIDAGYFIVALTQSSTTMVPYYNYNYPPIGIQPIPITVSKVCN